MLSKIGGLYLAVEWDGCVRSIANEYNRVIKIPRPCTDSDQLACWIALVLRNVVRNEWNDVRKVLLEVTV